MRIHFIAIGGAAMHNLAMALHQKGFQVTGSDDEIFEPSRSRLAARGLLPETEGWFPERITGTLDAVILGMHARKDNPELLKAQELGLKIYSFPEFIYEQTLSKKRIVIGGSHGKTTITSMIMHVMKRCGKKFDYLVGSMIEGFETMAGFFDDSEYAVIEGDEYLASPIQPVPKFHLYHPHFAIISGIAWDHVNVFPDFEDYKKQFSIFTDKILPEGFLAYDRNDKELNEIVSTCSRKDITYFPYSPAEHHTTSGEYLTEILYEGKAYPLKIFGKHNLANLEAARLACAYAGIGAAEFYTAMKDFTGAARRLERIYEGEKGIVFKDFAHSPSKLKATIQAVREQFPVQKLIAFMELHTFSSLNRKFLEEYRGAMDQADEAIVYFSLHTFVHKKLEPFTEAEVKSSFGRVDIRVITNSETLHEKMISSAGKDHVLLLMSSGNWGGISIEQMFND